MGFFDVINHLFNFFLPALGVALLMAALLRLPYVRRLSPKSIRPWHRPVKINFLVGSATLLLGLVFFGRDGKMATYALLVVAMAGSQWWQAGR